MQKIAEGISDFGDYKAILFKTKSGRYFLQYEPTKSDEQPRIEWLAGDDYLEWLRCLVYNQHC
jgi:hypothetical protein